MASGGQLGSEVLTSFDGGGVIPDACRVALTDDATVAGMSGVGADCPPAQAATAKAQVRPSSMRVKLLIPHVRMPIGDFASVIVNDPSLYIAFT